MKSRLSGNSEALDLSRPRPKEEANTKRDTQYRPPPPPKRATAIHSLSSPAFLPRLGPQQAWPAWPTIVPSQPVLFEPNSSLFGLPMPGLPPQLRIVSAMVNSAAGGHSVCAYSNPASHQNSPVMLLPRPLVNPNNLSRVCGPPLQPAAFIVPEHQPATQMPPGHPAKGVQKTSPLTTSSNVASLRAASQRPTQCGNNGNRLERTEQPPCATPARPQPVSCKLSVPDSSLLSSSSSSSLSSSPSSSSSSSSSSSEASMGVRYPKSSEYRNLRYLDRRRCNKEAAQRGREARRATRRAAYYEQECLQLRLNVMRLQQELESIKELHAKQSAASVSAHTSAACRAEQPPGKRHCP